MNALTSLFLLGALAMWGPGCASHLRSERSGEVDSPAGAFVQYGLDRRAEAYLVCVHRVEPTGGAKNEVEIQAVVVDCIKGEKRVGERITFRRVSDAGSWDLDRMEGALMYVFLDQDADGALFVHAQDPQALWGYSAELQRIVEEFRKKG